MIFTAASIIIKGLLTVNNLPAPAQDILITSEEKKIIIGNCSTDSSGNFNCNIPQRYKGQKIFLLFKVRTQEIATAFVKEMTVLKLNDPLKVNYNTNEEFYDLTIKIDNFPIGFSHLNIFI